MGDSKGAWEALSGNGHQVSPMRHAIRLKSVEQTCIRNYCTCIETSIHFIQQMIKKSTRICTFGIFIYCILRLV